MEIGLFGKLPSHGDFLRRRVSNAFADAWDAWLQQCLAASRETLGDRWLDVYLTSPAWRFLCAAGACGPAPVLGLMVPSVDRVGRYFPLTLVAELPQDVNPATATTASAPFFDRAEQLLVETLETENIDFDEFEQTLGALADALEPLTVPPPLAFERIAAAVLADGGQSWQVPLGSEARLGPVFEQLASHRLSALYEPLSLWWTEGSSAVEPSCLVSRGLPKPSQFVSLLDGGWADAHWQPVPASLDTSATVELPAGVPPALAFRSAAASDVGLARETNEDAFLERPEVGLWAVADGLGGHREGEVASRMVCDALAEVVPDGTFEATIYAVRQRLLQVNEYLLRTGTRAALADRSASTVVVLLARGTTCAVLWAGDSRVYRWRAGKLELLTRDHALAAVDGGGERELANAITRAVGVQPDLALDLLRETAAAGDRFLLCSDGLTRNVPEAQIEDWLAQDDLGTVVAGLISATLSAGAPDNVTVLVAEAYADRS